MDECINKTKRVHTHMRVRTHAHTMGYYSVSKNKVSKIGKQKAEECLPGAAGGVVMVEGKMACCY